MGAAFLGKGSGLFVAQNNGDLPFAAGCKQGGVGDVGHKHLERVKESSQAL